MTCCVSSVVLNWNNAADTIQCLQSVHAVARPKHVILVVDNASTDDSPALIQERFPGLEVIEAGTNLGYAGGNNFGIRHALDRGAEWVCILNNDVIVAPDFLEILLVTAQARPDVGVVTPLVADRADRERVWALGSAVNSASGVVSRLHAGDPVGKWRDQPPFEVDVASGAAMLIKREVLERVGLMDEDFFLYYEETDWCLRIRQAGYRILAVPASVVWHKVSATLGTTSPVIDYYMLRNHLRLIARHWHGLQRGRILLRTLLRSLATIAAYTVKTHQGQRLPSRNARLLALRDALLGRWGKMGPDVARVCYPSR